MRLRGEDILFNGASMPIYDYVELLMDQIDCKIKTDCDNVGTHIVVSTASWEGDGSGLLSKLPRLFRDI